MAFPLLLAPQENAPCLSCGFLFFWHEGIYSESLSSLAWIGWPDDISANTLANKATKEIGHPKMTPVVSWAHWAWRYEHLGCPKSVARNHADFILRKRQKEDRRRRCMSTNLGVFWCSQPLENMALNLRSSQTCKECQGILVLLKRIFIKCKHPGPHQRRWELEMVLEPELFFQVSWGPWSSQVFLVPRC